MSTIKKALFVSGATLLFLIVASAVGYLLGFIDTDRGSWYIFLLFGVGMLVASGVTAFLVRGSTPCNVLCFCVNAAALGFLIRAWYIGRGLENNFLTMFLICLACVVCLWVYFLLSLIPAAQRHPIIFFWIIAFVTVAAYIPAAIVTETTFLSTFGYYMLVVAAFIFAMLLEATDLRELMRHLTISAYSVFAVAVIIAVILLSADGGDLPLDFVGDLVTPGEKKKKRRGGAPPVTDDLPPANMP